MNAEVAVREKNIWDKIHLLRGVQVMLDKDLAELYEVKPIRLREQVKRNHQRFPSDFMFQLADSEVEFLLSQNAIPSKKHLGGYLPYAFTEQKKWFAFSKFDKEAFKLLDKWGLK